MPNNPLTDAALAELDRQYGRAESETGTKIDLAVAMNAAYLAYPALRQRLLAAESRLAEAEREREAAEAILAGMREALDEARKDNDELDGTDAAHPAWWRGNDAGVAQVCAKINAILDGADVFGTASEPWESTRRRVAEARKDSERLDWLESHPRLIVASTGYRGAKDSWCWRDKTDALATHEAATLRAAIDAARGQQ